MDNPKPVKPWSYWNPALQLGLWFVAFCRGESGILLL
jgi:hypothetical protein